MSFKLYGCGCSCKHSDVTLSNNFGIADIIFNVDSSNSILDSTWNQTKEFLKKIINTLPISENAIRIGIVQFATYAAIKSQLTGNVTSLLSLVENMERNLEGASNGYKGFDLALEVFNTSGRYQYEAFQFPFPKIIISISDGIWGNYPNTLNSSSALKNADIQFTYILTYSTGLTGTGFPYRCSYTCQPYYIQENNTFTTDFDKITTFISGLTLMRQLSKPIDTISNAINDEYSFINFISSNPVILSDDTYFETMGKSGVLILNYTVNPVEHTLLFDLTNDDPPAGEIQSSVNKIITFFNLNDEAPSRLIRVIRTGIDVTSGTVNRVNILSMTHPEGPTKYIYFQVNKFNENNEIDGDQSTTTFPFTTYSDWSFIVSLKYDYIGYNIQKRICFNVLI